MKEENNIKILDALNKGCCMGSDAVKFVLEKIEGKSFEKIVENAKLRALGYLSLANSAIFSYVFKPLIFLLVNGDFALVTPPIC